MAKINGNVLTEKGVLKPKVRDDLTAFVKKNILKSVKGAEAVEGKNNLIVLSHIDSKGTEVFSVLEIRTTLKHPSNLAEKKTKSTEPKIDFVIEPEEEWEEVEE